MGEEIKLGERLMEEYAAEHDGDVTDFPLWDEMSKVEADRDTKLLNVGAWIKSLKSEHEALKQEKSGLNYRQKCLKNKWEHLMELISDHLTEGKNLKDSRVVLGWRKNVAVNVPSQITAEDLEKVCPTLIKVEKEISLSACKEEIKTSGKPIVVPVEVINDKGLNSFKDFEITIPDCKNLSIR
jgi:hypothetical protein